ncbi:DUF4132 domain-containing protein [Actinomadura sp. NEAU-AAG7]|uniref:DUF4132 domain-containing protein n=1 Tax=Actinomadura sp. NEAU-AAG7 TaxID=2839640 RepID=UPI001BE46950|nr:DUF4132 domain-containing protein [Actinomadura sp. NEAU-AAG7]MBT2211615.1 DUF4132 domain-containing protein [Actinomadura sp. NEAU-AAG7]
MNPPAVDEDAPDFPEAWLRERHPRRDRPGVPDVRPDAEAVGRARTLVDAALPEIEHVLALPGTTPLLAEHARAHLAGSPSPLGAAVVASLTLTVRITPELWASEPFRDAWTAEHGLAFAVCAYLELSEVVIDYRSAAFDPRTGTTRWDWSGVRERGSGDDRRWWTAPAGVRRLRALLAAAGDDVYAEAAEAVARHRRTPAQQVIASYLMPTRRDWLAEARALPSPGGSYGDREWHPWMLLCALGDPDDVGGLTLEWGSRRRDVIATLLEGVGPDALAALVTEAADERYLGADTARLLLDTLARLPVDAAFQALVDRLGRRYVQAAAIGAANRYPARALRLLAASAGTPEVDEMLSAHLLAHPELADAMLPGLPEESRAAVDANRARNVRLPEADDLPPLLTDPPWTRARKKARPPVIKGLPLPALRAIVWEPGERDDWTTDVRDLWRWMEQPAWAEQAARFEKDDLPEHLHPAMFLGAPEDLVRPLLARWEPSDVFAVGDWEPAVVARFELDALEPVLFAARRAPAAAGHALMPYLSDDVARTMADWLLRRKRAGETARAWFRRHGLAAAPALLPGALGPSGTERRAAEGALRFIAAEHGAEGIVEAARVHGDAAVGAIAALLSADPLDILPAKVPVIGDWADVRLLPQLLLRDSERALPGAAARHVLTMLALSRPGEEYAGVAAVRDLCDPASLAEFGWAVFGRWEAHGAPSKDGWALTQLGLTGDDETVRRLAPMIRAWPGDGGHARAVTGLDVLAAIGTDTALMHLHAISQRVRFKALRARAAEKIEEVAAGLELTPDQLADRLVPDLGLDAGGGMTLDYGPRRFRVAFDESLKPFVTENGERRKTLPKPGAKDDPDLAPAAHKAFAALKKDARTVASGQLRRLEDAMVARRRWPAAEFHDLLVAHPLVGHLVRRLVWLADDAAGTRAFRVAEDGTYADIDDDTVELPASCEIRVAHPIDLGESVATWSEVFADYAILQPFPQLGRAVHTLTPAERGGDYLTRFENLTVPVGRVLALTRRGWERGVPQDAGVECWISRRLSRDRYAVIDLTPGIIAGAVEAEAEQTFTAVRLADRPDWGSGGPHRFGDLDPVIASELLADLTALTE